MKSSRPVSAKCRSSKTSTTVPCSAMRSKNVRQAPNSWSAAMPHSTPSSVSSARSIQSRSSASVTHCGDRLARPSARVVGSSSLSRQPAALADHLAQRPEGDALAVGRRAAAVPVDGLDEAVDVLRGTPTRAGSCRCRPGPMTRHDAQALLAAGGVEQVLEQAQLLRRGRRTAPRAPPRGCARHARRRRAARATPAPAPACP